MKDIVIIGGGPGGYVAAIRAAQLGADVYLIEKDRLGGTCLNRGCIPTKALYKNAEIMNTLKKSEDFGIAVEDYAINVQKLHDRKNTIVDGLVGGVEKLLDGNKVEVIKGKGVIKDNETVIVELEDGSEEEVKARHIIIATGSAPDRLPIEGINEDGVFTTREMLQFEEIPEKLVIIGGGVVGMEFASIFNAFGSEVTVIEFLPNILSGVDTAISKRFKSMVKKKGIDVITNGMVTKIEKDDDKLEVHYESKKKEKVIEADKVLVAAGRKPLLSGMDLDELGINYDKKGIQVDEHYETSVKGIYAIGDVNGKIMLAHAASHQGIKVVERIMGTQCDHHEEVVPSCIFVFPEIAFVGMTEAEAKEKDIDIKVGKFMFSANGKAMTLGEDEGFVKIIANSDDNTVLGVHILGPHASDLIHEGALAVANKLTIEAITRTIHAHPTLGEAFHEAALDVDGEGLHILPRKK